MPAIFPASPDNLLLNGDPIEHLHMALT
jgi:hypothetical protein